MKRRTETAFSVARRRAWMERPARRRSSPMEPAERLNRLAQQHCDAFSEHGLRRCDCIESDQKPPKPQFCVQWISTADAPGERTTAGPECSPGCCPTVRVAAPEVADPAHAQRGMPRIRHKRGGVFPSVGLSISLTYEQTQGGHGISLSGPQTSRTPAATRARPAPPRPGERGVTVWDGHFYIFFSESRASSTGACDLSACVGPTWCAGTWNLVPLGANWSRREALTCLPHAHHACARSFHVAALLTRRKWADPPTAERVG